MRSEDHHRSTPRKYPPFFEKIVPLALGTLVIAIVILMLIIFGVAMGWLPSYGG